VHTATLDCGTVLSYEASSFVPASGESVPCRRHGYCVVQDLSRSRAAPSRDPGLPRARPRAQRELSEWLRGRSVTTIHALLRQRFTLRMIAIAERDGLVVVDLETGRVAVHRRGRSGGQPADGADHRGAGRGDTEDRWQAGKRAWDAAVEAEEAAPAG
jgi:hypothetical protein